MGSAWAQPHLGAGVGCRHLSHLRANPQGWHPKKFTHANKTLVSTKPRGCKSHGHGTGDHHCTKPHAASPNPQQILEGVARGAHPSPLLPAPSTPSGGCGSKWAQGTAPLSPASRNRIRPRSTLPAWLMALRAMLRAARPRNALRARPECPARSFPGRHAAPMSGQCHN